MTSRPWMPWHIADFVGDTQHLDAAETGAYLLLLGHYWLNGRTLPTGDAGMARVARMTRSQWKRSRDVLLKFFPDGRNKRADEELSRAEEASASYTARARQAAEKRWSGHAKSNAPSIPEAMLEECLDMPSLQRKKEQKESKKDSGPDGPDAPAPQPPVRDIRKDLFDRGLKSLATMTGKTPDSCRSLVGKWLASVHDEAIHVLAAIDDAERNRVADPVAWISRSIQPRTVNGSIRPTVHTAVENLLDRVRSIDQPGPSDLRHRKG